MDSDFGARISTSSKRYQFLSDPFSEEEEMEGDDEVRTEYMCPFCAEDFDMVGLCCHIDEEHMMEAKNGACPICETKVGMDLVGHITLEHGSLLKVQRKRRFRKGGSNSTLSFLRKELREGNLHSLLQGSSCLVSSANTEADPLLSSFMYNPPAKDKPINIQPHSSDKAFSEEDNFVESSSKRKTQQPALSDKDHEERARKCEFVQGLLLSTFLDDSF
ncbi:protein DEHYDRATION-INDUCED 19 homolog 4-like [Apium graveolens]|uniref:protein DEHYDRATION-INDUCED 19 homolog 4-like n=1 Tax=Apium graveolens TaxID=4045 RepID=UPI003D7A7308